MALMLERERDFVTHEPEWWTGDSPETSHICLTRYSDMQVQLLFVEDENELIEHVEQEKNTSPDKFSTMHDFIAGWDRGNSANELLHEIEDLQQRLDWTNQQFHRKASEVLIDESALHLLADLYKDVVLKFEEFDLGRDSLSLAKLTAAHFCEVGAKVIYITEAGQRFIDSIRNA